MKINKIELYNFGSYEDYCEFDLTTNDPEKRIVVVGGKNGAGKTTLFTAVEVCLYGHFAFGYKVAGKIYFKAIFDLINSNARIKENMNAFVKVSFSHTESRDCNEYLMERHWTADSGIIKEELTVYENNNLMADEELTTFQNYLIHLIPPDLLKLYFFDGEKITDYFLSEQKINIREALMILSGNDTFDILHDNVKRVLNQRKGKSDNFAQEYLECQNLRNLAEKEIENIHENKRVLEDEIVAVETELENIRNQYASKGGLTLVQWNEMQADIKAEEEKRERINWQRKQAATDILPFIIMKKLVADVLPQIKNEEEFAAYKVLEEKLTDPQFLDGFKSTLKSSGLTESGEHEKVIQHLTSVLLAGNWEEYTPLFCLSDDEKIQIHAIIKRIKEFDINSFKKYQKRINRSIKISKEIRDHIQGSDIEHVEEYVRNVTRLEGELKLLETKLEQNEAVLLGAKENLEAKVQLLKTARKNFEAQLKRESVEAVSGRVLLLLEDLQQNIYSHLIKQVEESLNYKLRLLIRKEDFYDEIKIDHDFNVHILRKQEMSVADLNQILKRGGPAALRESIGDVAFAQLCQGKDDLNETSLRNIFSNIKKESIIIPVEFDKDRMSSGEKQIFVMSLYWAIMQQSDNDLPFIIDTPFARIDTEHRANITEHFFMDLKGQLFVLSTNEEINAEHLKAMDKQISHVYMLEYGEDKRTYIHKNQYFEV